MRRLNLLYVALSALVLMLAYANWPQRLLLIALVVTALLLASVLAWRLFVDRVNSKTDGAGLPAETDVLRSNLADADLLTLEQDILSRINEIRGQHEVAPLALRSDLLYVARRHSLRMIKLPFFGTKDPEEGAICNRLIGHHGADSAAIHVVRVWDDLEDVAGYCISKWMRRRRTRAVLLSPGLTTCTVGIVRNRRDSMQYVTALFLG